MPAAATALLTALALATGAACSSSSDSGAGAPRRSPPTTNAPAGSNAAEGIAMTPIDRYRDHLSRVGGDRGANVIDHAALRLGDVHFFEVDGDARGHTRAAAMPAGIVTGARAPGDAWYALLGAGDAATIADRIAWLESRAGSDSRRRARRTIVVAGAVPPAAKLDPKLWRAARTPRLDALPDGARRLTAWIYASDADEPVELVITAPPAGPASIEVRPAHTVVAAGDIAARTLEALRGSDDAAIRWALVAAPRERVTAAAPLVAALLTRPDPSLRADAALALAGLRAPDTVEALGAACARETDPVARQVMLSALGNIGTANAVAALAALHPRLADVAARLDLVHALARAAETSPAPAHAALAAIASSDTDASVRSAAAAYAPSRTP